LDTALYKNLSLPLYILASQLRLFVMPLWQTSPGWSIMQHVEVSWVELAADFTSHDCISCENKHPH